MLQFLAAVLPWVCIGTCVTTIIIKGDFKKKMSESDNYMMEGMCIGLCAGLLIGGSWHAYGMLIGLAVGMSVKRKHKK